MVTVRQTQQGPVQDAHLQKTHLAPKIKRELPSLKGRPRTDWAHQAGAALFTLTDDLQLETTVDPNQNHFHHFQLLLFTWIPASVSGSCWRIPRLKF